MSTHLFPTRQIPNRPGTLLIQPRHEHLSQLAMSQEHEPNHDPRKRERGILFRGYLLLGLADQTFRKVVQHPDVDLARGRGAARRG